MGRPDTGAITVGQCLQLHVKTFSNEIKTGRINVTCSISWNTGAEIKVSLISHQNRYYAILDYFKKDNSVQHPINYRVQIVGKPSNLGKGTIYYFLCPFSGKRCKILYMGYGSHYFKSRQAYRHRIYYASQLSSRLDKHNDKYWSLDKKLNSLYKKHSKSHYKGKPTKLQQRMERLEEKQNYHDHMRWNIFPKSLMKSMGLPGITDVRDFF